MNHVWDVFDGDRPSPFLRPGFTIFLVKVASASANFIGTRHFASTSQGIKHKIYGLEYPMLPLLGDSGTHYDRKSIQSCIDFVTANVKQFCMA